MPADDEDRALQKYIIYPLALLFVLAVVSFTVTYTVRFTEAAVVTTFGSAGSESSIKREPGLYWKWFYPIQSVTKYDTRTRFVNTRSESQQTADNFQIVVEAYCTYRVDDPLKFFQRFSNAGDRPEDHFAKAEETVRSLLRSAMGETSKYRMDELFTPRVGGSKLPELEAQIASLLTSGQADADQLSDYGIEVTNVGINRVVLPEETTSSVIKRMGSTRKRLADELQSRGDAAQIAIEASARADAARIEEFAKARASDIRAQGELQAAKYLAEQQTNPELAVFLQNLEMMRNAMSRRTTLILSANDFGLGIFSPDILRDLGEGEFPVMSRPVDQPRAATDDSDGEND